VLPVEFEARCGNGSLESFCLNFGCVNSILPFDCLFQILISLLIFTYCHITNAEADPVADPDALPIPDPQPVPEAKAAPEADPQFWGGAPVGRELAPGGSGGPSVCELTNQCCGMANSQCCLGGGQQQQQKCYTVWERKCDTSSKPVCNVISQRDCHNIVVRMKIFLIDKHGEA